MGSAFDDLAKALAGGTSRRRVLRGMLGGLIGAIAGTALPSGRTEAVEAGPTTTQPPVKPAPALNQAPVRLNQAPVRLNQAPVRLHPAPVQINQRGSLAPNSRTQGVHADDGPTMNQSRRPFNQQDPRWNQMRAWLNQHHKPGMNQHGPRVNQGHTSSRFNQGNPHLNQRNWPGWNQGHHRFNQGAWPGWNQSHRH
jgi:hypothetical protein